MGSVDVCLTGTSRLARDIAMRDAMAAMGQGSRVWASPLTFAWSHWVGEQWKGLYLPWTLLSPVAALAMMKGVIDRSEAGARFLSSTSTARAALRALRQCLQYDIDLQASDFALGEASAQFAVWARTFLSDARSRGLMLPEQMIDGLVDAIDSGAWSPPAVIRLVGLDVMTPAQRRLLDAMRAAGVRVVVDKVEAAAATQPVAASLFGSEEDELRAMAEDVAALLGQYTQVPERAPRIAIVVPDLAAWSDRVESALTARIAPQVMDATATAHDIPVPWRASRGAPLLKTPHVRLAFDLLALRSHRNTFDRVSALLLSPIIPPDARDALAAVEIGLRERNEAQISLDRLIGLCGNVSSFSDRITVAYELIGSYADVRYPSEWAGLFNGVLNAFGWHGADQSSYGFQVQQAWSDALDGMVRLDQLLGRIDVERAYAWLREIVAQNSFQARSPAISPIEIMEPGDIVDRRFDHVWVVGLSSPVLPMVATPSPFVPTRLLASAGVPGSTPDIAMQDARRWLPHLLSSAPSVQVSCAHLNGDGAEQMPSPLIAEWSERAAPAVTASDRVALTLPVDDPLPPVTESERARLRRGEQILADTAASPLLAFLKHRVALSPIVAVESGLSAGLQGEFLHAAREAFWKAHPDSVALQNMLGDPVSLNDAVAHAVEQGLTAMKGLYARERLGARLVELERQRAAVMLAASLRSEAARVDPFIVVATEYRAEAAIAGFPFRVRIDRIDRVETLEGPRYLIVDDKTGLRVAIDGWREDKLTSPQLPIYATDVDLSRVIPSVDGVMLAHLTPRGTNFLGVTNWTLALVPSARARSGDPASEWAARIQGWRRALTDNASAFLAGAPNVGDLPRMGNGFDAPFLAFLGGHGGYGKTWNTSGIESGDFS